MRVIFALLVFLLLGGARDPILVPEVSQHEVRLRQGFTGTELLLFGAILTPEGSRAGRDYDIVILLRGPTQSIVVREKKKVAGVWINADSTDALGITGIDPMETICNSTDSMVRNPKIPFTVRPHRRTCSGKRIFSNRAQYRRRNK